MQNFTFHNPTRILFGQGRIADLAREIPASARVLITYGGGSVVKTGTLAEVKAALPGYTLFEFGGIEPNPTYETLMQAVELARRENVDFLLAVGGGSVIDGTKFIAAAIPFAGEPWDILAKRAPVKSAIAFGSVLTLPATGSEMNNGAVITRRASNDKLAFSNSRLYPRFSVLDPTKTFTLPPRQIAYESDSLLTALHLVSRTDWLCVASQWHMEMLGHTLDLASYPLPWLSEDCPVYMSWHKSSNQDAGLNWLKQQVRTVCSI